MPVYILRINQSNNCCDIGQKLICRGGEEMSYKKRVSVFIVIDSCLVFSAIMTSYFLVYGSVEFLTVPLIAGLVIVLCLHYIVSFYFRLYKKIWEYASIGELWIILKMATITVLSTIVIFSISLPPVPYRFLTVVWFLYMLFIGGSRLLWRIYRDNHINEYPEKARALIVGAGSAGTMVARQLLRERNSDLIPVAFIDDDKRKQQLHIMGIPVVGGVKDITKVVNTLKVDNIIVSIPSLGKKELNTIFQECTKTEAETKIMPMLEDLITGKISVSQFRDIQVEDLLERDPVELDMSSIVKSVKGKVVLITGAGGSIGSEISRQISVVQPSKLILLGHGENSIFKIEIELKEKFQQADIEIITEIADIQDAVRMNQIVSMYQPDIIYHAAAHKHVPLMEKNPEEAVKNNIIGTFNIANAASLGNVNSFVMVSTDKAVNPTSVMGASKRLAEMVIQSIGEKSPTKFVAVRFGNVLGSRGSVIPLFKRQIEKGGPITITHPDMIRYFMTIPEASELVIQAGALAKGGEIFVLDMGDPVRILDLAANLVKLSGCSPEDIAFEFTGIRSGEKLVEELLSSNEIHDEQIYPKIFVGKSTAVYVKTIEHLVDHYHLYTKDELRNELLQLANGEMNKQAISV